jgi:amino-acid N-acetyltransferase
MNAYSMESTHPLIPIRAAIAADIDPIYTLIEETSRVTTVLPRSRESICLHLRDFLVVGEPGTVKGCAMLYLFTPKLAEIKSLVVHAGLRGQGIGARLVRELVAEARRIQVERVFALTDNVPFFSRCGFSKVPKESFPHKVWRECIHCPKFLDCQEDAVELVLMDDYPKTSGP